MLLATRYGWSDNKHQDPRHLKVRKSEEKGTYYEWMDSIVHEDISYSELVPSQVDLVLQVEVEVLQEEYSQHKECFMSKYIVYV